jgi:hypothetical protein
MARRRAGGADRETAWVDRSGRSVAPVTPQETPVLGPIETIAIVVVVLVPLAVALRRSVSQQPIELPPADRRTP